MMQSVLCIGYSAEDFEDAAQIWLEYDIQLCIAHSEQEAVKTLKENSYVCVVICSDTLDYSPLIHRLREIKLVPVVILSPQHDAQQRAKLVQQGAAQYILHTGGAENAASSGKDSIRYYLGLENPEIPVTIIQRGDLMLYVEYRTVEVRGKEIGLTRKEFDILRLLIMSPRHVFTYEMLLDQVWGDEYTINSKKTVNNRVISLRQKLKVEPDVPEIIINIHGVGYKYVPV